MSTPGKKAYWLIKFAPFRTSWAQIVKRGTFTLRGVRNAQARNYLTAMRVDDPVLFYHSQQERAVVGLMEVSREACPDPTSNDPRWLTCDFVPVRSFPRPITLAEMRADSALNSLPLIRQPRLSVMPIPPAAFHALRLLSLPATP